MNDLQFKGSQEPPSGGSPLAFFLLVLVLSVPFWVIGGLTHIELLPGLPIDALMAVCPGLAALILVRRKNGRAGVSALLKRAFDYKRIRNLAWYIPILLLNPLVSVLSFIVIRLSGTSVPVPKIEILPALILCILFFISALGEELGWSGYVIDPMQRRLGALQAGILLGLFWAVYHYIALFQVHRPVAWIAWWSLGTVALRVIMVWLFNNTGKSVLAVTLFHMTINVTWQFFPINGSYYDPQVNGPILALTAVIIIAIWRPKTLSGKV